MKKKYIYFLFIFFFNTNLFADSLTDALLKAYNTNPKLNAERENLNISQENINISKSDFLPSVTLSGSKSKENTNKLTNQSGGDASITDVDPETQTLLIEQKIFQGFAGIADLEKNELGLDVAKVKLLKVEQEILYQAVEAYTGLILANKKYKINRSNINLLERQVETDQARLEKGQISLVDLAQSESSLAGANAKFIESENEVVTGKLIYENIIGEIENLNNVSEKLDFNLKLPQSLTEANEISQKNNPELIIAKLELQQSEKDIQIARAELSPSATLSFESSRTDDLSSTYNERDKEILKATVSWPIFAGGKNRATLNKNRNLSNQKRLLLEDAITSNKTTVASAWSSYQSSKSLLNSVRSQVKAAEIANEGITIEYESGLGRSTLDVIQSNSFLLDSKTSLANAERNYLLSQFKLLESIGLLTTKHLQIN
jgi:outer membrane protein